MSTPIDREKDALRDRYRGVRRALRERTVGGVSEKVALDGLVLRNLVENVDFARYRAVLCYVSFGIEVDTHALIDYLAKAGVPTYAPRCYASDRSMRFFAVDGLDGLVYGEYRGILEPVEDTSRELTDYSDCLCVVPALAFDTQGYRLGWGGGYYDRFFEAYPSIFKVGLAYSSSTTRTPIPRDGHDVPVDVVVTDKSIVLCGGRDEH